MKNIAKAIGFVLLVGIVIWITVNAITYNAWSDSTCKDAGLTWVKEYPYGDYGCAEVIPFDEVPHD